MVRVGGGKDRTSGSCQSLQMCNSTPGAVGHGCGEQVLNRGAGSEGAYCKTTNVTRRFIARPSGLALSAIGAVLP